MRVFRTTCKVEHPVHRSRSLTVSKLLVDTGSEYTRLAAHRLERLGIQQKKKDVSFIMAHGTQITRNVGFAIIRVGTYFTIDEVVFAERGDMQILGARTLEGLNLTVDAARKKLVAAGPLPAAATAEPAANSMSHVASTP